LKTTPSERAHIVKGLLLAAKKATLIIIEPADLDNSKALRVTSTPWSGRIYSIQPMLFYLGQRMQRRKLLELPGAGNIMCPVS